MYGISLYTINIYYYVLTVNISCQYLAIRKCNIRHFIKTRSHVAYGRVGKEMFL